MARISLGNLAVAGSRAASGLAQGRLQGTILRGQLAQRDRQAQAEELRLALSLDAAQRSAATDQRGATERDALRQFYEHAGPEGEGLAGLPAGASSGIYSGRLAARRAQTPSPGEQRVRHTQETTDLRRKADDYATYLVGLAPGKWQVTNLRAAVQARYPQLDPPTAGAVATSALGLELRPTAGPKLDIQSLLTGAAQRLPQD